MTKELFFERKREVYSAESSRLTARTIKVLETPERLLNINMIQVKKAIMDFDPTGYPFEKFFGAILAHNGYTVETGVNVFGRCVNHEVDVVAEKDNQHFMIECKFHNQPGARSDVKMALREILIKYVF